MEKNKRELIGSAIELVKIGKKLEDSRNRMKALVEQGVPYDSEDMRTALEECLMLDIQWRKLEQRHLHIKEEFGAT